MKSIAKVVVIAASACLPWLGAGFLTAAEKDSKPAQFVYIAGAVTIPQRYIYTDGLTLGKAIEMAKGVTSGASGKVTLTREGADIRTFAVKNIQKGRDKDIKLQPGDKVFVARKK